MVKLLLILQSSISTTKFWARSLIILEIISKEGQHAQAFQQEAYMISRALSKPSLSSELLAFTTCSAFSKAEISPADILQSLV